MKILVYYSFYKLEIREGCKPSYNGYPCLWLITWDPTQPIATRPLAIQKDVTWYTHGWDLTKNICEIFGQNGYIRSTYAYTPFGSVTTSGDVTQPIQWSSEYYDNELALVYYNYRHYNLTDGRWINRDPIAEQGGWNLYTFVGNKLKAHDVLGLVAPGYEGAQTIAIIIDIQEKSRRGNEQAYKNCNIYKKYFNSKCCLNGEKIIDPYIKEAKRICDDFVGMYSINDKVISAVECVAKCLAQAEEKHTKIANCNERNARRLEKHVECYYKCGFYLIDRNHILGLPKGGWSLGITDLIPDFIESINNRIHNIFF